MFARGKIDSGATGRTKKPNNGSAATNIRATNKVNKKSTESVTPSTTSTFSLYRTEAKVIPKHAEGLLNGLEVMWRQNVLCDVTLVVENSRFRAHRALLAASADYFHQLMTESTNNDEINKYDFEIELEGLLPSTVEFLLECMYTGRILINDNNVEELLVASAYLKYYSIEEACADFLRLRLNVSNCLSKIGLAGAYNLNDLMDEAMKVAARNFMDVTEGPNFRYLQMDHLVQLLARDDVKVESELNVFHRMLSWIDYDRPNRLRHAPTIMQHVRLPLLSTTDIVDHIETVEYLMDIAECQKSVQEALHYHCLPARQSILQNSRTCPRTSNKKDVILAIGGAPRLKSDTVSTAVSFYDPDTNSWGRLTELVGPRHHHAAAVLGNFLYVAGGESTNDQRSPLNTAYRYDPRTNKWLQIASMKNRRESFKLGVLNGMLYAVGGRVDEDHSLSAVERYNPAVDKWDIVAPISAARRSVAVTAHGGRLYAMGGSGHKRISSRVERYNPLTNQWENRKSLTIPRFFALLEALGDNLILFGGATLGKNGKVICVQEVENYNPITDTWTNVTPMIEPRAEAGSTVLNNNIYILGGYSWDKNTRLSTAERYNAENDCWKEINPIEFAYTGIASATVTVYNLPKNRDPEEDGVNTMGNVRSKAEAPEETGIFHARVESPKKANSAY